MNSRPIAPTHANTCNQGGKRAKAPAWLPDTFLVQQWQTKVTSANLRRFTQGVELLRKVRANRCSREQSRVRRFSKFRLGMDGGGVVTSGGRQRLRNVARTVRGAAWPPLPVRCMPQGDDRASAGWHQASGGRLRPPHLGELGLNVELPVVAVEPELPCRCVRPHDTVPECALASGRSEPTYFSRARRITTRGTWLVPS